MRTGGFDLLNDQELIELYYLVSKLDIDKEFQVLIYGELKARGFIRSKAGQNVSVVAGHSGGIHH